MGEKTEYNRSIKEWNVAATLFKYKIRHIRRFSEFKGLWLHSNACKDILIEWYVKDTRLYIFYSLSYTCALAIISYKNCLVNHLIYYLHMTVSLSKKFFNQLIAQKKLSSEHIHWFSKGRSEYADTEELALAINIGTRWTLHRLLWDSWGKLVFNTSANREHNRIEEQPSMQTIWKET